MPIHFQCFGSASLSDSNQTYQIYSWDTENGLPQNNVLGLAEDHQGFLWIATFDGLAKFDGQTMRNISATSHPNVSSNYFLSVVADSNHVWFTNTEQIGLIKNGKVYTVDYNEADYYKFKKQENLVCIENHAHSFILKNDQWMAREFTIGNLNIAQLDQLNELPGIKVEKRNPHDDYRSIIVQTSSGEETIIEVTNAIIKSNRSIWLGTSSGLYCLQPNFIQTVKHLNEPRSKPTSFMVYYAEDSSIWYNQGCGTLYNLKNDQLEVHLIRSFCPWTMTDLNENELLVGDINSGIVIYDKKNREQRLISHVKAASIYKTNQGKIFIGTRDSIYQYKNEQLYPIYKGSTGQVYQFYEDRLNNLFFCSSKGIGIIKKDSVQGLITKENGLPTNDIRTMYQDREKNYWLGTSENGLFVYSSRLVSIHKVSQKQPKILDKNVWSIIEDQQGNLWMSSNHGIYMANKKDLLQSAYDPNYLFRSRKFSGQNGMDNAECNSKTQNKGFQDEEGRIWFSSVEGPVFFNPEQLKTDDNNAPLALEQIFINGKRVSISNKQSIRGSEANISIKFSHPNFSYPDHLGYYYKIDDSKTDWTQVSENKTVNLVYSQPGDYNVRIKNLGLHDELDIDFTIRPTFWQNRNIKIFILWFLTLSWLFFMFLFNRKKMADKSRIRQMSSELRLLELRALQSQMNPHFIFNCLNSIQSLFLKKDFALANMYISEFSTLLRMNIELAQRSTISIAEDLDLLKIYVKMEQLQFDEPFDFEINIDDTIDIHKTFVPTMVTHTYVENAIKHGLKPLKGRKGQLSISIKDAGSLIHYLIQDNGQGIDDSKLLNTKATITKHKSVGLENTTKRVYLLNALKKSDIQIDVDSQTAQPGIKARTTVTIKIPKNNKNENINH